MSNYSFVEYGGPQGPTFDVRAADVISEEKSPSPLYQPHYEDLHSPELKDTATSPLQDDATGRANG